MRDAYLQAHTLCLGKYSKHTRRSRTLKRKFRKYVHKYILVCIGWQREIVPKVIYVCITAFCRHLNVNKSKIFFHSCAIFQRLFSGTNAKALTIFQFTSKKQKQPAVHWLLRVTVFILYFCSCFIGHKNGIFIAFVQILKTCHDIP